MASSAPAQVAHRARPGQPAAVLQVSAGRLRIREATGRNDGPDVEAAQRAAGAQKGDPWCGCEQFMEQRLCGLPSPAWPAAARNWSLASSPRTYFIRGLRGSLDSLRPGHQVTFYYATLGRVGHVGRLVAASRPVRRGRPARGWVVRAGNTGTGGGRDGAGVHDVWYPTYELYAAANWLY
ncbi:hypothetical protein [Hymenobacter cheonanensis]|uniref:hypothetical protein n=1 Tax=Hymenobacter sp. CA2-7 TaxID=3063993 RepID=UPI0027136F34|nr:hypothetical protein [Hymenobacter sp. CA2-7]MDO7886704.1 hypothetical protein [Hymenobacter sp. CA2-7]